MTIWECVLAPLERGGTGAGAGAGASAGAGAGAGASAGAGAGAGASAGAGAGAGAVRACIDTATLRAPTSAAAGARIVPVGAPDPGNTSRCIRLNGARQRPPAGTGVTRSLCTV